MSLKARRVCYEGCNEGASKESTQFLGPNGNSGIQAGAASSHVRNIINFRELCSSLCCTGKLSLIG